MTVLLEKTCANCGRGFELEKPQRRTREERGEFKKLAGSDLLVDLFERYVEPADDLLCEQCLHADEEREHAELQARERRGRWQLRLEASGLPAALRGIGFSGFIQPEIVEAAKRWALDGGGLCLVGNFGVGKTRLAAAAAWHRLQDRAVRWVSVARLMSQLRASFGDEDRAKAVQTVIGAGAIVLDDLDKANPTEYGREILFSAIDNRIQAQAPLLVTTNLPPSAMGERLGDAIKSRLAGYCEVVEMVGPDRRVA